MKSSERRTLCAGKERTEPNGGLATGYTPGETENNQGRAAGRTGSRLKRLENSRAESNPCARTFLREKNQNKNRSTAQAEE
jgi:hypothetical protein